MAFGVTETVRAGVNRPERPRHALWGCCECIWDRKLPEGPHLASNKSYRIPYSWGVKRSDGELTVRLAEGEGGNLIVADGAFVRIANLAAGDRSEYTNRARDDREWPEEVQSEERAAVVERRA